MGFSQIITDAVSFIHQGEEKKKFISKQLYPLKKESVPLSQELLEDSLVFPVTPAELNCKIAGVDSGFVDRKMSSIDLVLVRAVGVCFEFENSKVIKPSYFPSIYTFPTPHISKSSLELDESNCSRSLIRLREEIFAAKKCIEKFSPTFCLLDGSIVPQYADKPRAESKINDLYHSIVDEFQLLYKTAHENNCTLVGCVEDSRGSRFCGLLQEEVLKKKPVINSSFLENLFDSSLLDYFLLKGERTLAFRYTKNVLQHAILKDFEKKWSENIFSLYLKPSSLDSPLRVEFLNQNGSLTKKADQVASTIFTLSEVHREYAYPSVLIEADLRARLTSQEIEIVFGKIFDKLSRHVKLKMRRDKRPF